MNRIRNFGTVTMAAVFIFAMSSCECVASNNRIVEFSCEPDAFFMNNANGGLVGSTNDGKIVIYLTGATFLCVATDDETAIYYLYLPEDGNDVDLRVDGDILYVNNIARTVFVDPDEPRNFSSWFKAADDTAFKALRIIGSEEENACSFETNEFRTILAANPHVFGCFDPEALKEASTKRKPLIVWIDGIDTNEPCFKEMEERMDYSETRLLMIEDIDDATVAFLTQKDMPKLDRLILPGNAKANDLLNHLSHVKALTIDREEASLDFSSLRNLKELHFVEDDLPLDLGQLPNPEALLALSINLTTNVTGLEKLTGLEYLNPGEMKFSDESLSALLENHPNLVFLDLLHATVESLTPLTNSPRLEVVAIGETTSESEQFFSPLSNLRHLRYVALTSEAMDPETLTALRKACPQVMIYKHDTFCMGSGWLLLFLPILPAILLAKRLRVKAR